MSVTERIEAALDELSAEAQKIEDAYNADDFDGDLDASELEAEVIWECCRRIRKALAPSHPETKND